MLGNAKERGAPKAVTPMSSFERTRQSLGDRSRHLQQQVLQTTKSQGVEVVRLRYELNPKGQGQQRKPTIETRVLSRGGGKCRGENYLHYWSFIICIHSRASCWLPEVATVLAAAYPARDAVRRRNDVAVLHEAA